MGEPVNEGVRLLDGDATELESLLLRAGRRDVLSDTASRARRIADIKVAARATAAVGVGLLAFPILRILRAGASKWVVLGLGVAAAGAGALQLAQDAPPERAPAPVVATSAPKTAEPRGAAATSAEAPASAVARVEPPRPIVPSSSVPAPAPDGPTTRVSQAASRHEPITPSRSAPARAASLDALVERADAGAEGLASRSATGADAQTAPPPPQVRRAASLREEIAELEGIRRSIEGSRADLALAALDQFQSAHPSSTLAEEADVLRIEALVLGGHTPEARRVVERFRERYPKSSYMTRVRALIDRRE